MREIEKERWVGLVCWHTTHTHTQRHNKTLEADWNSTN